uniref:TIL domain-containing protein n=1 Tax=Anopheles gambiae TaxID=7165 RepID=A0A1S4HEN6_ANOGA
MRSVTVLLTLAILILGVATVNAIDACTDDREYLVECGPEIELTCDALFVPRFKRSRDCTVGCFCKPNYIRSREGGHCIPITDC